MPLYKLYSSEGCHLCELAFAICQPLLNEKLQIVDIVDDETLVERYGVHIPVLERLDTHEELFWPFDAQQVQILIQSTTVI